MIFFYWTLLIYYLSSAQGLELKYSDVIWRSRCAAKCTELVGEEKATPPSRRYRIIYDNVFRTLQCNTDLCLACLQPCNGLFVSRVFCERSCRLLSPRPGGGRRICRQSCAHIHAVINEVNISAKVPPSVSHQLKIVSFRIGCEDRIGRENVSVLLIWYIQNCKNSTVSRYPLAFFVVVKTVANPGFVRISSPTIKSSFLVSDLRSSTNYTFTLYAVTISGAVFHSDSINHKTSPFHKRFFSPPLTDWSADRYIPTPGGRITANLTLTKHAISNCVYRITVSALRGRNRPSDNFALLLYAPASRLQLMGLWPDTRYRLSAVAQIENSTSNSMEAIYNFATPNCEALTGNTSSHLCQQVIPPDSAMTTYKTVTNSYKLQFWKDLYGQSREIKIPSISFGKSAGRKGGQELIPPERRQSFPQISVLIWLLPVVFVSFIGAGLLFIFCKLRRSNLSFKTVLYLTKNPVYAKTAGFDTDPLEIDFTEFQLEEELGEGEFGIVYKARVMPDSQLDLTTHVSHVAVKVLKSDSCGKEFTEFVREIEIMKKVSAHPNVISLLGYCTRCPLEFPPSLITELCPAGDLHSYLEAERLGNRPPASVELLGVALQISTGMAHLARAGMIHRDLACRNVLIGERFILKIADFGLCRRVASSPASEYTMTTSGRLPFRWLAPESFIHHLYSTQSDVWAFGVVLWELYSLGLPPYSTMTAREVQEFLIAGHRLPPPELCPQEVSRIMSRCWAPDPNRRPTFDHLVDKLQELLAEQRGYLDIVNPVGEEDAEEFCRRMENRYTSIGIPV